MKEKYNNILILNKKMVVPYNSNALAEIAILKKQLLRFPINLSRMKL